MWQDNNASSILWLTGDAGCGKSTLFTFISELLGEQAPSSIASSSASTIACTFFCSKDFPAQSNARSVLRNLLLQVLLSRKSLIRSVRAKFGSTLLEFDQSFETLWGIFCFAVDLASCDSIYIMIDALDECNAESKGRLIAKLATILNYFNEASQSLTKKLKILVTGQPQIMTNWRVMSKSANHYHIGVEDRPQGMTRDILLFIDQKVDELIAWGRCTTSFAKRLKSALNQMAQNSFLWVSLVLEHISNTVELHADDLHQFLAGLPSNLHEAYAKYLPSLKRHNTQTVQRYVRLLIASLRPLQMEELGPFAILTNSSDNRYSTPNQEVAVVRNTVEMIFGPLVVFSGTYVGFVHTTFKDFLLELNKDASNELSKTFGTDMASSNLTLATACIRYLFLDEVSVDFFSPTEPQSAVSDTSMSFMGVPGDSGYLMPEDFYDIEDVTFLKDEEEIHKDICRRIRATYQPYDYAAVNWAHHFAIAERIAPAGLKQQVAALTDPGTIQFSNWYKYLAQKPDQALPALSQVSPLTIAAFFNHAVALEGLMQATSSETSARKGYAMHFAASKGNFESAQILLDHRIDVNAPENGLTPLQASIRGGHGKVCAALLSSSEIDPNFPGHNGRPPLLEAVAFNEHDILKLLLDHPLIQVNVTDYSGRSPFIEASIHSCTECLRQFSADGRADTGMHDKNGRNALSHAASTTSLESVKFLLKHMGEERHMSDRAGRNALSYAAEQGCLPVVRTLVNAKLSISAYDAGGRNAISWAANSVAAVQEDSDGRCALKHLVKSSPKDADAKDANGWSPLAWAMDRPGHLQAVKILVENGELDINERDETNGRPVLSWAASEGFEEIVSYLLNVPGMQKNLGDFDGRTCLSYAAGNGHKGVVLVLLADRGINRHKADRRKRSPAFWAELNSHDEVVEILKAHDLSSTEVGADASQGR